MCVYVICLSVYLCIRYVCCCMCFIFFFKQKTAYEMHISDWSSDVCSSDLSIAGIDPVVTLVHRYESESSSSLSYQDVMKGGYNQFDLRAGAQIGNFGLTLFGKNLTDVRGVTAVQPYARATGGALYRRDLLIIPTTSAIEPSYSSPQEP